MERPVESLTRGRRHHFFGYYDKCPWDSTGRYVLSLEIGFVDRPPGREDRAVVGMVDLADGDRRWILTDTYPDAEGRRALILFRPEDGRCVTLGRFYSPPELVEEIRCDLHPRWNRDGTQVCFDSAHEGERQMYAVDVRDVVA